MSSSGFATVNPATGEQIETFSYFSPVHTEKVIAKADRGFQWFRKADVRHRAQLLAQLAVVLRKHKAHLAKTITTEMGKILAEAEAQGSKLIALATHGRGGLKRLLLGSVADRIVRSGALPVLVCRPTGKGL